MTMTMTMTMTTVMAIIITEPAASGAVAHSRAVL